MLTLNIVKNRYGDVGTQQYDVDYGKNKYKAVTDYTQTVASNRRTRDINPYRSGRTF